MDCVSRKSKESAAPGHRGRQFPRRWCFGRARADVFARALGVTFAVALVAASTAAELTAGERWVTNEIAHGRMADLTDTNSGFGPERKMNAKFLRALLTEGQFIVPAAGVRIFNAVFTNALDLRNGVVLPDTRLVGCLFRAEVLLTDSEFKKGLGLDWSEFLAAVDCRRARITGDMTAERTQFRGPARCQGLKVGGSLWLEDAKFFNEAKFGYSVIGEELSLKRARFYEQAEGVEFYMTTISGQVNLDEAEFHGPANFIQMAVKGDLNAGAASFLNTNALGVQTTRRSHYNADFGSLRVEGFTFFIGTRFDGEVSFRNAHFTSLYLDEVVWPTRLDRIKGTSGN